MTKFISGLAILYTLLMSPVTLADTPWFWAKDGVESIMSFEASTQFYANFSPVEIEVRRNINRQITFLIGSMHHNDIDGAPKLDQKIKILKVQKIGEYLWQADYSYSGTVVSRQLTSSQYQFALPINPEDIYQASVVNNVNGVSYPCSTDRLHTEEQYFWYFWKPELRGCPLKHNKDYVYVTANMETQPSVNLSFPEYDRLFENGVANVYLLIGMDNANTSRNPMQSSDINSYTYRQIRSYLQTLRFKPDLITQENYLKKFPRLQKDAYLEVFETQLGNKKINVKLFFGPSGNYDSILFRQFLSESLLNGSLLIYSGHSGLGENLDTEGISSDLGHNLQANQNKYQIYFFNGCSTYPYYNLQYFNLKKSARDPNGTKNLDIVTNGLATYFNALTPSNKVVIDALYNFALTGKKTSYQEIITSADSNNLLAINGDEDN